MQKGPFITKTRRDMKPVKRSSFEKFFLVIRTIPIGIEVLHTLKQWRMQSNYSSDGDLVFPNEKGAYENHDNMMKRQFKPLFKKINSDNPSKHFVYFNWHTLRHFAISCWIEVGLSPKTIQTFAGHSSLQVTIDRYGHLFPSETHQSAMDEIAASILSS